MFSTSTWGTVLAHFVGADSNFDLSLTYPVEVGLGRGLSWLRPRPRLRPLAWAWAYAWGQVTPRMSVRVRVWKLG